MTADEVTPAAAGARLGSVADEGREGPAAVVGPLPDSAAGRRLREVLARDREVGSSTVVLVTGPVTPGELGRAALALISPWIAEEKRVAVVDLFVGGGAFVNPLAGEREEGLGDHLLFGSSFAVMERKTAVRGLTLIPAGAGSPETADSLSGEAMKQFIVRLRERYDIAFLCGAISPEAEGRDPLLDWVDGWVGVVEAGVQVPAVLGSSYGTVEITRAERAGAAAAVEPGPPVRAPQVGPAPESRPREEAGRSDTRGDLGPTVPPGRREIESGPRLRAERARPVAGSRPAAGPGRGQRRLIVALVIVVLAIPAALALWQLKVRRPDTAVPLEERSAVFPKPKVSEDLGASSASEGTRASGEPRSMGVAPPAPAAPQGTEEIAGSAPQVSEVENGSRPEAQPLEETQPPQESSGPAPPPVVEGGYAVHVSSYKAVSRAESEASALRTKGYEVEVVTADLGDSGIWYRVCVGRVPTRAEADALAERLKDVEGFSYTRVVKRPGPRPQG